jgi:DNA polymerase III subunit epsilon
VSGLIIDRDLAEFDVETTGVNPEVDRIIEIAVRRHYANGGPMLGRTFRLNPGIPIPAESTAVHHITDADVADAPRFDERASDIAALLRNADLVAYNGRFDTKMVDAEFKRLGQPSPLVGARLIDPFRIFCQKHPRDLSAAVQTFCGERHTDAHSAEGDVEATWRVLQAQLDIYPDLPRTVAELAAYCEQRDPSWIDREGKLVWRDGVACINFGKFQGVPLQHVARTDNGFLRWVLAKDFPEDTKAIVKNALAGRYPSRSPVEAPAEMGAF